MAPKQSYVYSQLCTQLWTFMRLRSSAICYITKQQDCVVARSCHCLWRDSDHQQVGGLEWAFVSFYRLRAGKARVRRRAWPRLAVDKKINNKKRSSLSFKLPFTMFTFARVPALSITATAVNRLFLGGVHCPGLYLSLQIWRTKWYCSSKVWGIEPSIFFFRGGHLNHVAMSTAFLVWYLSD